MSRDGRRILVAQALRALTYGFVSVHLGVTFDALEWSAARVAVLLAAVLAGTAVLSVVIGRLSGVVGRRALYTALFLGLAGSGLVFGITTNFVALALVALTGTLSTEVVESGPFTSLEQAMLPDTVGPARQRRVFGTYNAIATIAGSVGALLAGGPEVLREAGLGVPGGHRLFLVLVPVGLLGAVVAASLSPAVEPASPLTGSGPAPLHRSRSVVRRLAALFALDSFGGGLAVQSFLVFFLSREFGLSAEALSVVFFVVGFLQAGSFVAATRLADRIGLLRTMVFTHLPSNLLLAAVPFAPNGATAVLLVLARFGLSQMDVPTRQAYVVELVDPEERVAAAAYTSSARYAVRPLGAALGGLLQQVALGLPLVAAGGIKSAYDLVLWRWFRRVPLPSTSAQEEPAGDPVPANGSRAARPEGAVPAVDR